MIRFFMFYEFYLHWNGFFILILCLLQHHNKENKNIFCNSKHIWTHRRWRSLWVRAWCAASEFPTSTRTSWPGFWRRGRWGPWWTRSRCTPTSPTTTSWTFAARTKWSSPPSPPSPPPTDRGSWWWVFVCWTMLQN